MRTDDVLLWRQLLERHGSADPPWAAYRPQWTRDAACREHPQALFFPERGQPTDAAKAICAACLVRAECLEFALEDGTQHGIWGGHSERERRALRRERKTAA